MVVTVGAAPGRQGGALGATRKVSLRHRIRDIATSKVGAQSALSSDVRRDVTPEPRGVP